ncbi:annexin A9 L homeolog [Xenopus laevis]|uniref:Annexin n=1 Tax=Xenopus laevis TaxID=8355 RepID=Q7ZWX0_XENLA|nr:annexin A9 L homeolog [Xenopus laevis]AAH46669.1 Anxa9-prov protein [Xenopus laevis]
MALTHEILSSLHLADKIGAWGTLGTIRPLKSFDQDFAVEKLAESLETKGNRQLISDIVTSLNNDQRQEVIKLYKDSTQQDLVAKVQKSLSGDLEKAIVGLLKTPAAYDAQELRASMKGLGTDEATLTEILCTRTNTQLREIQEIYKQEYKTDFEKNIISDTSEPYTGLLLALAKGKREKDAGIIDYALIQQDSKVLTALGPKNSPNSDIWIRILSERSLGHLRRVFDQYSNDNSMGIEDGIKKYFKGDFQKAALTLVAVIKNTALYFADKLHNAMKGLGTDENTISRVLISRSETDLLSIRVAYRRKYGKSLYSSLQSEVKGDLQACLLSLCRAEDL